MGGEEGEVQEGEEQGQLSMIGIALGQAERKVMNRLADSHSLDLVMTDDIREVLFMLVNTPCAGVVIGDRSQSPNVRSVECNLATLKRFGMSSLASGVLPQGAPAQAQP